MKTTEFIVEYAGIGEDAENMSSDHEIQLARQQCYHAARDAIALHHILKDVSEQEGLESWVSEKLTQAASNLKDVIDHLESLRGGDEGGMGDIMHAFSFESAEKKFAEMLGEARLDELNAERYADYEYQQQDTPRGFATMPTSSMFVIIDRASGRKYPQKFKVRSEAERAAIKMGGFSKVKVTSEGEAVENDADPITELDSSTMQSYLQKRKETPAPKSVHKAVNQANGVRSAHEKIHDQLVKKHAIAGGDTRVREGEMEEGKYDGYKSAPMDKEHEYRIHRKSASYGSDWDSHPDDVYHSIDDAKTVAGNMKKGTNSQTKITRHPRTKLAGPVGQLPESVVTESGNVVQFEGTAQLLHSEIAQVMKELAAEYQEHATAGHSLGGGAAPDSTKFRTVLYGMIEYAPNTQIHGYGGFTTVYRDFLKMGAKVPSQVKAKIKADFENELSGMIDGNVWESMSIITSDGYRFVYNEAGGTAWSGLGIYISKERYAREAIGEGKWTVNAKTGAKLDPRTGAVLPAKEKPMTMKQMFAQPKAPAAPKLSIDDVWRKVEAVVGQIYPDGDPIDWLLPWFRKQGIADHKVGDILAKAARKNGYKDVYDYYNHFGDDLGYAESVEQVDELSSATLNAYIPKANRSREKATDDMRSQGTYDPKVDDKMGRRAEFTMKAKNKVAQPVEEAGMSPQQQNDFDRMRYGAMKRSEYDAKWKKPLKSDDKVIYGKNAKTVKEDATGGATGVGGIAAGIAGAATGKPGTGKPKDLGNKVKRTKIQVGKGVY